MCCSFIVDNNHIVFQDWHILAKWKSVFRAAFWTFKATVMLIAHEALDGRPRKLHCKTLICHINRLVFATLFIVTPQTAVVFMDLSFMTLIIVLLQGFTTCRLVHFAAPFVCALHDAGFLYPKWRGLFFYALCFRSLIQPDAFHSLYSSSASTYLFCGSWRCCKNEFYSFLRLPLALFATEVCQSLQNPLYTSLVVYVKNPTFLLCLKACNSPVCDNKYLGSSGAFSALE